MTIESQLAAIEQRVAQMPEGPYFVSADEAEDCPDHEGSGLAMVDTGRSGDWPIARLCEWPQAHFIAHAGKDVPALVKALRDCLETAEEMKAARSDMRILFFGDMIGRVQAILSTTEQKERP